jgi:hypothetical protein
MICLILPGGYAATFGHINADSACRLFANA